MGYACPVDKQRSSFSSAVRLLPLPDTGLFKNSQEKEKYTAKQDLYTCLYANLAALICEFSE